jgi:hypothetical protein
MLGKFKTVTDDNDTGFNNLKVVEQAQVTLTTGLTHITYGSVARIKRLTD